MGLRLGIDSGGTKTWAVLFDDEYRLLGTGAGGGANENFESAGTIAVSIRQCLDSCLQGYSGATLDTVYITALVSTDVLTGIIKETCTVRRVERLSEGEACLLAGAQKQRGFVALAGTGATLFALDRGLRRAAGGWGSWIGDEGSGYYVGQRGIAAAIRQVEGRGPATAVTGLIQEHFGLAALWDIVPILYANSSPRSIISSVAKLVAQAAKEGDAAAAGILRDAGTEMAAQMLALMNREPEMKGETISLAGSVWKSGRMMFDSFCAAIREREPDADIRLPLFEPVIGGVIAAALEAQAAAGGGAAETGAANEDAALNDDTLRTIAEQFDRYRYRVDWNGTL
ncbi:BadF/BadG/BcrA/BcrD ATPase family protein [Paenibacillus cymbidii]|uniref:BadF/BadG/BcrA/BcrD ATPase family protein n=1 Tax=Paenibacillus cymbidii TaxID=1639034 RepID=UPI00108025E4|nr:BadF/BadG/BcrA/BcrD ATPase family protein [Paenibacillus cymbidii]